MSKWERLFERLYDVEKEARKGSCPEHHYVPVVEEGGCWPGTTVWICKTCRHRVGVEVHGLSQKAQQAWRGLTYQELMEQEKHAT